MDRDEGVDAIVAGSERWPAELAAARSVLLGAGLTEAVKWAKACYCHGGANVAILQEMRDHLSLMFFKGVLLDDPDGVLEDQGPNSRSAKRVRIASVADVERLAGAIRGLVASAVAAEDAGTPLPEADPEPLVAELAERLAQDGELAAAFDRLTPGRQREYHLHVSGAKRPATRRDRVERVVPRILDGRGLRDR